MNPKALLKVLAVLALVLVVGATADAQLSKHGHWRGMFGARTTGTTYQIEKGHIFFVGDISGVFFNDVANGFLDKSSVDCPGVIDIVNGLSIANHGYCIVTDKDGDKVFYVWKGKDTSPTVGGGTFQFTGGTGKYSGIKGPGTYRYAGIGKAPAYSVIWEGEWQLP
jgi:hypothetical protein